MKKPIDRFKGLSEEEKRKKESLLDEENLEKYDKLAMFLAALKAFLPPLILIIAVFMMLMFIF